MRPLARLSRVCATETVGGLQHILCSQDIQWFVQLYSKLPSVICVHVCRDQPRPSVICMSCVLCNRDLNGLCVCVLCNQDLNSLCVSCMTEALVVCECVLCNRDLNGKKIIRNCQSYWLLLCLTGSQSKNPEKQRECLCACVYIYVCVCVGAGIHVW